MRQLLAAVGLLLSLLTAGTAVAQVPLPALRARVTDLTATLDENQRGQLEQAAQRIEQAYGAQVAILLLPTTVPEPIEAFGIRLAEAWKAGRQGIDDGIIVIVAKDDRTARIEVGYGLEGAVPDAVAKRLIDEVMTPRFRAGDFYGGLAATLAALGNVIAGEGLPPPSRTRPSGFDLEGNVLPVALMFVFVVGGILRAVLGRFLGACIGGGLAFFGAWLVLGSLLAGVAVALIAFFITLAGGGRLGGGIGGWGGGSGGRGGFGGGGFSGGGGGFGGGGASGRW